MSNAMRFELKGADELLTKLKDAATYDDVKQAVKINTTELAKGAKRNAVFRGHYKGKQFVKPTGNLKRSIVPEVTDLVGKVKATADYAPYVELGTRFMSAQPFIGPAFHAQKPIFLKDLKRLME